MVDSKPTEDVRLVTVLLGLVCGAVTFLFLLLIGGSIFLGMLLAFAVMILAGFLHYLIWGRRLQREAVVRRVYGPNIEPPPANDRPIRR
jgi:hypothetical protein